MKTRQARKALPKWSLYLTYLRLAVCLVSLPLMLTGMAVFGTAPAGVLVPVLLITACLYCDMNTVMRMARGGNRADT